MAEKNVQDLATELLLTPISASHSMADSRCAPERTDIGSALLKATKSLLQSLLHSQKSADTYAETLTFLQNTENPADILQHLHDKKQRVAAYAFNNDGKKAAIQEIEYLRDSAQQQAEAYGNLAIYADHLLTGLICTASLGFHEATPEQRIVIAHAGEVIEEIAKKAYCTPLSDSLATVKRLLGELNTEIMYEHGALHREAARHDINNVAGHAK